jgi:hypothetical protein
MFGQYGQSGTRAQQFRRNTAGKRGQRFAAAIACFSAALILLIARLFVQGSPRIYCFLFSVLLLGAGLYFLRMWKRSVESLTVEEALQQDPRPPILYLRPFKADKIRFSSWHQRRVAAAKFLAFVAYILLVGWLVALVLGLYRLVTGQSDVDALASTKPSAEEFLVSLLDPLGPVIAIGRPGEKIPPVGAARMYLGDEWKEVVQDLLKQSQLILMFAGTTSHFEWELQRVFQNDPFVPTILILPFFQRYRQDEVDRFVSMFAEATGLRLSSDLRKTRAAYFPSASEAVEIRDSGSPDDRALDDLNPFLGPIAQIMENKGRLGWTEGYIEEARASRVSDRKWVFGTAAALILLSLGSFWIFRRAEQKQREGEIAYQFFADAFQNINPCADPKLAAQVPDSDACTKTILNDIWRKADVCADLRLATIFPDPDSCHFAALRAYRANAAAKRK